jgi:RimJ/RimL family protein N-acetyltransferase
MEGCKLLKKRELSDSHVLYNLMADPEVFPFVRQKAYSLEEFMFLTKQIIEAEENGTIISRTILDEWQNPIGTINLFDVQDGYGFLGTWIGRPYFGKGFNQLAKDAFFGELFFEKGIETVFMRIRKVNTRSRRAAEKLPYVTLANELRIDIYNQLNQNGDYYDLFQIQKDAYMLHTMRQHSYEPMEELKEA